MKIHSADPEIKLLKEHEVEFPEKLKYLVKQKVTRFFFDKIKQKIYTFVGTNGR